LKESFAQSLKSRSVPTLSEMLYLERRVFETEEICPHDAALNGIVISVVNS
jgi:hypothetical protein